MTRYEEAKWFCEKEIIEIASRMKTMEEEVDRVYKAAMYIIGKYKNELIEEFKVKIPSKDEVFNNESFVKTTDKFTDSLYDFYVEREIFNVIGEEMKKRYPDPWYSYGIANVNNEDSK